MSIYILIDPENIRNPYGAAVDASGGTSAVDEANAFKEGKQAVLSHAEKVDIDVLARTPGHLLFSEFLRIVASAARKAKANASNRDCQGSLVMLP
jgi:hypothetical protein